MFKKKQTKKQNLIKYWPQSNYDQTDMTNINTFFFFFENNQKNLNKNKPKCWPYL